jgi:uncharacterized protein (TIGR00369 family)
MIDAVKGPDQTGQTHGEKPDQRTFAPADPDFERRVRDSFARQPFMTTLGAAIAGIEPGYVEVDVPFSLALTQQHGYFHAGVTSTAADNAGGYAAYTLFPANSSVLTVEFKINLLAPAKGEKLRAIGQVIKSGRTLTICDLKVFALDGSRQILCASGQQTLIRLDGHSDAPASA